MCGTVSQLRSRAAAGSAGPARCCLLVPLGAAAASRCGDAGGSAEALLSVSSWDGDL